MNFFGVGPLELLVILIVALVFVGPERLPRLAADLARTIRELRKYTTAIADEFGEVVKDFEKDTADERGELTKLSETLTGATKSVTDTLRGARADAEGVNNPATPATNGAHSEAATGAWRDIPEPGLPAIEAPGPSPANGTSDQRSPASSPSVEETP